MRSLLVVFVLLFSAPAMALDFSKPLIDGDGAPMCLSELREGQACPPDRILTLGRAARYALERLTPDDSAVKEDEKFHRGELAISLVGASELSLTAGDLALIRRAIGRTFGPAVVFAAWKTIDANK